MELPGHLSRRGAGLCDQCSKIDFLSLFTSDLKAYWLGTLSIIRANENCPFCRLVVNAISNSWMAIPGDVWSLTDLENINIWVKTTFWAHCDIRVKSSSTSSEQIRRDARETRLKFRPALGTDWVSDDRWKSSYGHPRFTICELDKVSTPLWSSFPGNLLQDQSQVLQRRSIGDVVDISLIRSWIEHCQANHSHVDQRAQAQMRLRATGQFRVYDIKDSRLIEPEGCIDFVALSYVWGDAIRERQVAAPLSWWGEFFDRIDDESYKVQGQSVRFEKLPRVIQDASYLLQRLDRRYLWVDLLCIHQQDLSKKRLLVNKMHDIYEGASLTLVAAGGEDANSPLHGLRENTRCSETPWTITTEQGDLNMLIARPDLKGILSSSKWLTRGWTFQEDLLSSRCLYFTKDEVFYSCDEHLPQSRLPSIGDFKGFKLGRFSEWREGYILESKLTKTAYQSMNPWNEGWIRCPVKGLRWDARVMGRIKNVDLVDDSIDRLYTPGDTRSSPNMASPDFQEYAALVREYTKRHLTSPGDVIHAFLGILHKFGASLLRGLPADVEHHGLWNYGVNEDEDDTTINPLEMALLWTPYQAIALRRRNIKPSSHVTTDPQLPSWSFSGWVGAVDYKIDNKTKCKDTIGWVFDPVTFAPKTGRLRMQRSFKWSSSGDHRVIAWLLESEYVRNCIPDGTSEGRVSCTLSLFTHIAKVDKLTQNSGFMSQTHQIWYDHSFCNIHSTKANGENDAAILPDAGTIELGTEYKLVHIGTGYRDPWTSSRDDENVEWVVLLVEKKNGCYERVGLTTVLPDEFIWNLEWTDIV